MKKNYSHRGYYHHHHHFHYRYCYCYRRHFHYRYYHHHHFFQYRYCYRRHSTNRTDSRWLSRPPQERAPTHMLPVVGSHGHCQRSPGSSGL